MSTLRSVVDELAGEGLELVDNRQLEDDLVELDQQIVRLSAQRSRRLTEIDRRGSYEEVGYLSTTSWLRDRCRISVREATKRVHRARSLASMPHTMTAYQDGELTVPVVDLLTSARKRHPDTFVAHEATLVEEMRVLNPRDASRLIAYWRQALDHHDVDTALQRSRRRLSIASTFEGMVRGEFELDPESGEAVMTALRALSETTDETDDRSPTQRRADALVDLCRDYLDHGDTPVRGGE
ncbi:MAG: 13E12 repeat family protein, partial [Acidimicrobiia bacterium]|nr:13E12 repeat family protein [Acidimicrobiia bacterium]